MTNSPYRAAREQFSDEPIPMVEAEPIDPGPSFDQLSWSASRDMDEVASPGGRQVLGWTLALLAALWIGYSAWAAGRSLASEPLSSPAVAQWAAILTGPLALMGLVWLMFGRTRRREAQAFTRSVAAMKTEAQALQDVLAALTRQIGDNHRQLGVMAGDLMGLGDTTATRLGAVTADLRAGSAQLAAHGAALDQAAQSARVDIGVLLSDLPTAEASARRMAETLRDAGQSASDQAATFEQRVASLAEQTRDADTIVREASANLLARLADIDTSAAATAERLGTTSRESTSAVDALLDRASVALTEIRGGIDAQSAAIGALLAQSQAGIGRAGIDASEALGDRLIAAGGALDMLSARIAEQERGSQRMIADIDTGLSALDERFMDLAKSGDERAGHVQVSLSRLRGQLELLTTATTGQDHSIDRLAERTSALRAGVEQLGLTLQGEMTASISEAESKAQRLLAAAEAARPHVETMRDSAEQAAERIERGAATVGQQQEQLAALMTSVDLGVSQAEQRLSELSAAIGAAGEEAQRLSGETGPALVAALVQVREAASHAADRAREAIAKVIPESADKLSAETRAALERAIRDSVDTKLAELDQVATRAVETAREASDRLTQQMLSIGQSAAALEDHIERNREAQRKDSGEEFARRVSLLMDSMHSASIDVQKILSDEVDEKAWSAYLKGNRGIFTRRAARLIGGSETKPIATQYESDPEFQSSVDRYVHDFESMLRRVLAERDGGMIAVTLMSSDMGKLYAALAPVIDRRR